MEIDSIASVTDPEEGLPEASADDSAQSIDLMNTTDPASNDDLGWEADIFAALTEPQPEQEEDISTFTSSQASNDIDNSMLQPTSSLVAPGSIGSTPSPSAISLRLTPPEQQPRLPLSPSLSLSPAASSPLLLSGGRKRGINEDLVAMGGGEGPTSSPMRGGRAKDDNKKKRKAKGDEEQKEASKKVKQEASMSTAEGNAAVKEDGKSSADKKGGRAKIARDPEVRREAQAQRSREQYAKREARKKAEEAKHKSTSDIHSSL